MRRRDIGPWLGARSGKLVPSILIGWESAEVTSLHSDVNAFGVL